MSNSRLLIGSPICHSINLEDTFIWKETCVLALKHSNLKAAREFKPLYFADRIARAVLIARHLRFTSGPYTNQAKSIISLAQRNFPKFLLPLVNLPVDATPIKLKEGVIYQKVLSTKDSSFFNGYTPDILSNDIAALEHIYLSEGIVGSFGQVQFDQHDKNYSQDATLHSLPVPPIESVVEIPGTTKRTEERVVVSGTMASRGTPSVTQFETSFDSKEPNRYIIDEQSSPMTGKIWTTTSIPIEDRQTFGQSLTLLLGLKATTSTQLSSSQKAMSLVVEQDIEYSNRNVLASIVYENLIKFTAPPPKPKEERSDVPVHVVKVEEKASVKGPEAQPPRVNEPKNQPIKQPDKPRFKQNQGRQNTRNSRANQAFELFNQFLQWYQGQNLDLAFE